jgi:prolyl oligopeptidase
MAAFVEAGGIFVHAHLRGGGEFGLSWWQAGRLAQKQNAYNDLYAIAEALLRANLCTARTLAVTGASNGGLMAAVALTQRPDLWGVVVPRVPVLDLIGACREPYGKQAVLEEMADIGNPQEVRRLASFSPYELIRAGVNYPAVFIDSGDTDPRCPAWHARKFAARLQAATAGAAPILVHVWENVGHGWATDKKIATAQHTEWLAFTMQQLDWPHWFP